MFLLEIIKTIILGVVQGITEWLPISSTGHMILVDAFMPLKVYADEVVNKEFVDMFMVVIQFGSILAVLLLYFHKLNPFSPKKDNIQKRDTWVLWSKVLVASVPAAVIGLLFDDIIDALLYNPLTVAIALIVYGILFIIIEKKKKKPLVTNLNDLDYKTAFKIGAFQMLALIPGTSRSGSTILGATIVGCSRKVASEFSFFMAIPVMFGASLLKIIKLDMALDLSGIIILLLGMVVAFVVSVIVIKSLMRYIRKHDFTIFGYYRIVLGIIVIACVLFKVI
ncbi:MAG: undecaprenyl-diphosphate phosphatase [Firmicutes bacterium]|nr:undecaprenyl-diphosphate phosphatase [Erysipelotrichaceae bacterium]MDD6525147.1 undecaprenyl-diphosphate phosphatase [Bacillota bacterium]MDD7227117.1 undecaprenyl-diphosphate phosphatase [Bacillota bacterium]MDY4972591.1 undecaprenyl-diphosphate phosphatase [Erysipelotrichaceae bacterium]MDY5998170.1 undecaprenyl-diphosphate phosphatase [Erysipelotrichaceae bacterium]